MQSFDTNSTHIRLRQKSSVQFVEPSNLSSLIGQSVKITLKEAMTHPKKILSAHVYSDGTVKNITHENVVIAITFNKDQDFEGEG